MILVPASGRVFDVLIEADAVLAGIVVVELSATELLPGRTVEVVADPEFVVGGAVVVVGVAGTVVAEGV